MYFHIFILGLLNGTISISDYNIEWWISRDVEGRGFGFIRGIIPEFAWMFWGNTKSSVSGPGFPRYEPGPVTMRQRRWASYLLNNLKQYVDKTIAHQEPYSSVWNSGNAIALYPGYSLFGSRQDSHSWDLIQSSQVESFQWQNMIAFQNLIYTQFSNL
jgi:hypothetical protein